MNDVIVKVNDDNVVNVTHAEAVDALKRAGTRVVLVSIFSSTGHRPASLCHGPLSVVRPSVCALTFSLTIFFSETTYRILMKFH